jgi:hypothetical protein
VEETTQSLQHNPALRISSPVSTRSPPLPPPSRFLHGEDDPLTGRVIGWLRCSGDGLAVDNMTLHTNMVDYDDRAEAEALESVDEDGDERGYCAFVAAQLRTAVLPCVVYEGDYLTLRTTCGCLLSCHL